MLTCVPFSSALAQDDAPQTPPSYIPPPPSLAPAPEDAPPLPPRVTPLPPSFQLDAPIQSEQKLDALLPASATSAILGGVLLLAGALQLGANPPEEYCGATGCVDRPNPLDKNIGATLLGAGAGFGIVGAFGLLGWAVNRPDQVGEARRSAPMMTVGFGITSAAAASVGLGFAQAFTYDDRSVDLSTAWPFLVTASVLGSIGIPLLVVGATIETPESRREARISAAEVDRTKIRSKGMVIAGGVLTAIATLAGVASGAFFILDLVVSGTPSVITAVIALPTLGGSLLFGGVGIPLIVIGNSPPKAKVAGQDVSALLPEVRLGAGTANLTWSLP